MNTDQLRSTWAGLAIIGAFVLVLVAFPVSIQITPNASIAQEPTSGEVTYTLQTVIGQDPPMAFIGVGGEIDGVINPTLTVQTGDTVTVTVINGDPVLHDLVIEAFNVTTGELTAQGQEGTVTFVADRPGEFEYFCSIPGHREIGMSGLIVVEGEAAEGGNESEYVTVPQPPVATAIPAAGPAVADAVSITRNPADVPEPVGDRDPQTVRVDLTAMEVTGVLADGTTFDYFTFDGTVPGPMIRVREGDTVELYLTTADGSAFPHSIDLHAVNGPGGGAEYTQTNPGETHAFRFRALTPGLFVYHCATPSVAHHIANGMYGLILVEPEGGLPPVDREFYVMQSEVYTAQAYGTPGHLTFSHDRMLAETPEYYVFNGAAGALTTEEYALRANVGETVRIFFGVGGPNKTSSFHVIGEIFDRVYNQASLTTAPMTDVQTTTVAPGGATLVEFTLDVPGRYILVDHALSRVERGLAGYLYVEGPEDPTIYSAIETSE
jgi:nitrite reductase (NO-forming)